MRIVLGMIGLAVALSSMAASAAEDLAPCVQHLTFRWTSGDPITLDVLHPDAASLRNPPFLRDPEILSVSTSHNWLGPTVAITLGRAAATVVSAELSAQVNRQMLIMLGDTVVSAAIVRTPLQGAILFDGLFDD